MYVNAIYAGIIWTSNYCFFVKLNYFKHPQALVQTDLFQYTLAFALFLVGIVFIPLLMVKRIHCITRMLQFVWSACPFKKKKKIKIITSLINQTLKSKFSSKYNCRYLYIKKLFSDERKDYYKISSEKLLQSPLF